jgi:LacI family transcriptional regulator
MPFVDRLRPPLTSVRIPHYQLGTEAAALLIERIDAADSPVKVLFLAPELVARGSAVPPPSGTSAAAVPLRRPARG